jgi:hypothetical protein
MDNASRPGSRIGSFTRSRSSRSPPALPPRFADHPGPNLNDPIRDPGRLERDWFSPHHLMTAAVGVEQDAYARVDRRVLGVPSSLALSRLCSRCPSSPPALPHRQDWFSPHHLMTAAVGVEQDAYARCVVRAWFARSQLRRLRWSYCGIHG